MAVNFAQLPEVLRRRTTARRMPRAAPAVAAGAFWRRRERGEAHPCGSAGCLPQWLPQGHGRK